MTPRAWKTILAIDFDRWAAETYRANFPGVEVRCASVADEIERLPDADVVLGGPPCQPFSTAGEGKGKDDARDCIPDFLAAVRKVRPRMFLMENVPGLLNERHARYLGGVVREMEGMGYAVDARELDAVNFGVPQFRNRVWYWGIRTDVHAEGVRHRWPRPTHAWPPPEVCMFGGALLPGVTVGQALGLNYGMPTTAQVEYAAHNPGTIRGPSDLVKRQPHGTHDEPMCTLGSQTVPLVARYDHGVADPDAPCPTLKAGGNIDATGKQGGGCPPAIEYRWSDAMLEKHPPASPASPASPAPTVQAKWFKGGAEGLLQVLDGQNDALHDLDEPIGTLQGTAQARGGRAGHHFVKVRRLTPLECLRLQSGPDDFRWPEGITKTAMYRVVGNGWACGIAAALSRAFADADPKARSVIDLFCGGGLGACGWHQRYWRYVA